MTPTTETTLATQKTAAPEKKEGPFGIVTRLLEREIDKGSLLVRSDYSFQNALTNARAELRDMDLTGVQPESIVNALYDMVVQALDPLKDQCYFIKRGNKLTCQRGYHGDIKLATDVVPGMEPYFNWVADGEPFSFAFIGGRTVITRHEMNLNRDVSKMVGAYMGFTLNGVDLGAEVMTIDRIKKSWTMSTAPVTEKSPHVKFPDSMAIRTVTRKRCKPIINSSNDSRLLASVRRQDYDGTVAELEEVESQHAHQGVISVGAAPALEAVTEGPKDDPSDGRNRASSSTATESALGVQKESAPTQTTSTETPKTPPKSRTESPAQEPEDALEVFEDVGAPY